VKRPAAAGLRLRAALGSVLALCLALGNGTAERAAAGDGGQIADLAAELGAEDGNARRKAVDALGELPLPQAVKLLAGAYRAEEHDAFGVKAACADALGRTGLAEASGPLGEMLEDPDYWVRKRAAEALGHVPGEGARQALARAAGDRDPRVRAAATLALGAQGDWAAVEAALQDRDDRVTAAAVEAFAGSEAPVAAEVLARAAESPSWRVRFRAAAALARRGDPRGLRVLEEGARSGIHVGAALHEAASAGPEAVPLLRTLYGTPEFPDKDRVLDALECIPGPATAEFFVALALDRAAPPEHRVRGASAAFDRRSELSPEQMGKVSALLAEADPNLVAVALQVLEEGPGALHLDRIAPLASHENPVVRHFALVNLAHFGGAGQEPVFLSALSDPNGANVRLALEALGRVGTRAALAAIRPLAQDIRLRRYAEAAIEAIEARP